MQLIQEYQKKFETYRHAHPFDRQPRELYEPVNYIMDLGGKRLRPVMALLSYGLFQPDFEPALPLAYAIEIFHNFSLVHDDIMDQAPLRRGKPTVHQQWDVNTAILSGDVMLICAYEYLLKLPVKARIPAIIETFNRVAREVCEGQQMDMNFERRNDVTIPEYIRMIELKTAVLIAGSMEMGALAAGASEDNAYHMYQFGRNSGIAFQLQDDILDTFGDAGKVGKRIGGDIAQNKKTYLILKALEVAPPKTREALQWLMATPTTDEQSKVTTVTRHLLDLDIPKLAEAEKDQYREKAMLHLEAIDAPEETKAPLRELVTLLIDRDQ